MTTRVNDEQHAADVNAKRPDERESTCAGRAEKKATKRASNGFPSKHEKKIFASYKNGDDGALVGGYARRALCFTADVIAEVVGTFALKEQKVVETALERYLKAMKIPQRLNGSVFMEELCTFQDTYYSRYHGASSDGLADAMSEMYLYHAVDQLGGAYAPEEILERVKQLLKHFEAQDAKHA